MSGTVVCPSCDRELRLPEGSAGKRARCPGCRTALVVTQWPDGHLSAELPEPAVEEANVAPAASAREADAAACAQCGAAPDPNDAFCPGCGAEVPGRAQVRRVSGRERHQTKTRRKKMASAAKWVLAIGILHLLVGTGLGLKAYQSAKPAKEVLLERYEPDELVDIDGEVRTGAEWVAQTNRQVAFTFGYFYLLGVLMLALYFWARRAPLPALVTALALYLSLQVLGAIVDPTTLVRALFWKALIVAALIGGIKAGVAERSAAA